MADMRITGGTVLTGSTAAGSAELATTDITITGGRIDAIGPDGGAGALLDASGLLVLPGIIDLHGDAFERQLQPRPGVSFPIDLALRDTEAQLLSNGITTAYHGVTLSWEPGLRSLDGWHGLLAALRAGTWACDMRVHLRWEAYNIAALDDALSAIETGQVHLLAFNDHTPAILRKLEDPIEGAKYAGRAGMKLAPFQALAEQVAAQAPQIPAAQQRLAAAARAAKLPMASHDDHSLEVRSFFRGLGATLCEFPIADEVAHDAAARGEFVLMGCPNVVRGGSHLGWASAATMAEAGVCTILTSDYYYPAMLRAAFILAERGKLDLPAAWSLISANPARAAGLTDRGTIEAGKRADIILTDPQGMRAVATIVNGRIAHLADGQRLRPAA